MKHAYTLIPHTELAVTVYAQITETANIIQSISAICNILHWCEWWIQGETDYDWCRTNLNFQITRKGYVKGCRLHGRFINEHRIHFKMNLILWTWVLSLIAWPGTDWLNRHDDYAFDDYTTLLFTADTDGGGRRKGRRKDDLFHFHPKRHRHLSNTPAMNEWIQCRPRETWPHCLLHQHF